VTIIGIEDLENLDIHWAVKFWIAQTKVIRSRNCGQKNKTKTGFYNSMDFIEKDDPMNNRALWIKESKMTPKQEKYLTEKYIRPMVRKMLKESNEQVVQKILKDLDEWTTFIRKYEKLTDKPIISEFITDLEKYVNTLKEYSKSL